VLPGQLLLRSLFQTSLVWQLSDGVPTTALALLMSLKEAPPEAALGQLFVEITEETPLQFLTSLLANPITSEYWLETPVVKPTQELVLSL